MFNQEYYHQAVERVWTTKQKRKYILLIEWIYVLVNLKFITDESFAFTIIFYAYILTNYQDKKWVIYSEKWS